MDHWEAGALDRMNHPIRGQVSCSITSPGNPGLDSLL